MTSVFLAPHHDDETLFGTFTLLREHPLVVVVYDGGPGREAETNAAMRILGCDVEHWRLPIDELELPLERLRDAATIYAPLPEVGGQPQHNHIGFCLYGDKRAVHYLTYTTAGKQTDGVLVPFEPEWVPLKLTALACYPSQSGHRSHAPHFMRSQEERYAHPEA